MNCSRNHTVRTEDPEVLLPPGYSPLLGFERLEEALKILVRVPWSLCHALDCYTT